MARSSPKSRVARRPLGRTVCTLLAGAGCLAAVLAFAGCKDKNTKQKDQQSALRQNYDGPIPTLKGVNLSDSVHPEAHDHPVSLAAGKNEWTSFVLEVGNLPRVAAAGAADEGEASKDGKDAKRAEKEKKDKKAKKGQKDAGPVTFSLRLRTLNLTTSNASIPAAGFETFQILPMPVDVNRAGYVRHTGQTAVASRLPRALLPVPSDNGLVNVSALRDPSDPLNPTGQARASKGDAPLLLWVDLQVPADAPPGDYEASCDLLLAGGEPGDKPLASVPLKLTVYNFTLPNERHLQMISQVAWEHLVRHYQKDFETVTPRLINRTDERYAGTVKAMDGLVALAQHHRLSVNYPRLQPTVKWPAKVNNAPPDVDWREFDSVVGPWLTGERFADRIPLDYWPLPEPDFLKSFDPESRVAYWRQAAVHFDQMDWLHKTSVALTKDTPGRITGGDGLQMSAEAAQILAAHPRVRVSLPLEDDQVQLAGNINSKLIDPIALPRVLAASPGLVFAPPPPDWDWPDGVRDDPKRQPQHWLRTDLPGLVPYAGAGGDERDVRMWAWLAFLRQAKFVMFGSALPSLADPQAPADPNELIWFYPGHWFGTEDPVPTIQLKWLRRAQQDYEHLYLAKERGEIIQALQMARAITKPVEIQPNQTPDQSYTLMSGTADVAAWTEAERLLAKTILLREPGQKADPDRQQALYVETLQWQSPQERPMLMGRNAQYAWSADQRGGRWVDVRLGLDIYNAMEVRPDQNELRWTAPPAAWEVKPQPTPVPELRTYNVRRETIAGRVNLERVTPGSRQPVELELKVDGFRRAVSPIKLALPIAVSERREGRFGFDGKLDDWTSNEQLHAGPLVQMLDRPSLQRQTMRPATTASQVYSGWAGDYFYLAFQLDGVGKDDNEGRNFVDYQDRRTWGEDLCEMLVQPVYADNTLGPVLHVVCKPNGSTWVERKLDPRLNANPWEPFESTGIRYAKTVSGATWTGEVAIPWRILADPKSGPPTLLRFNFAQHRTTTGESASWAGPVDYGRDDGFMGLIYLHLPDAPDIVNGVRQEPFLTEPRQIER